jgi:xanthine dehydrogenase YagS FAD-binding subunit
MQPFAYRRATDLDEALRLGAGEHAAFIAGGTDLLQLWNAEIAAPALVVDISRLDLDAVTTDEGGITIGALARLADVAGHPAMPRVVVEALEASASGQLRNAATVGGNLMQRTRCAYFRHPGLPCNKRRPGSGCGALAGDNRLHAIFGGSPHCVATHASDLAVALVALDAEVMIAGRGGTRRLALEEFFLVPGAHPERDTALAHGELITAVRLPHHAGRSRYLKLRDRTRFEFAVVSVAAVLDADGTARLCAGGVGTRPWRLRGGGDPAAGAAPLAHNGFKCDLLRRAVRRVLEDLHAD